MILKIWLQEYGPFREAEFDLRPLTVLVGPNASGKTTAMEALLRVRDALDVDDLYHEYYDSAGELCDVDLDETVYRKALRGFFKLAGRIKASADPCIAFERGSRIYFFSREKGLGLPESARRLTSPRELPPIRLLKFEPQSLRSASYLDANELGIRQNGYGLATVLADMKLQDDERLEWIESQVRNVIPSFERARIRRAQVRRTDESIAGHELIVDMKDAPGLSPNVVSDGTILVLGIVTSIATTQRVPRRKAHVLVLIDDLERGLHPRALNEFIGCLRRMTTEMNVQILATSHSPYLLDALESEEVLLTGFLEDGSATVCKLSQHPDFDRWKDVMTPGEFWSTAGEDWIRDVRT